MQIQTTPALEQPPPDQARRRIWRALRRQARALAGLLTLLVVVALGLSTLATWLQSRRDEARPADVLVVVAPELPSEALVEHSFDLFRRGYAARMLIVGRGGEGLRAGLVERGVLAEAMTVGPPGESPVAELRAGVEAARRAGATSVLLAGDPAELLLWLKLARDGGLRAYGAPTPGASPGPLELLGAGARYWRYALLLH